MNKHTILLINDKPEYVRSIIKDIEATNIHIVSFSSPCKALEYIETAKAIDLIITGLHFDDLGGWRFCRLLRSPEFAHTNRTPIIITSDILRKSDLKNIALSVGACASFVLPYNKNLFKGIVHDCLENPSAPPSPLAIIVGESNDASKRVASGLEEYGYKVKTAANGSDGLDLLTTNAPALVIMDHSLQDMNSLHLIPSVRRILDSETAVLIVIAAASDPNLIREYMQAGANIYIRNPFSIHHLIDEINNSHREKELRSTKELLELRTQSLREISDKFEDLFEHAPVGYHLLDPEGVILSMNSTELQWLGYEAEEIIGKKNIFDLQTASSAKRGREMFEELKQFGGLRDGELLLVRKDGSIMSALIQSSAILNDRGEFVTCRTILRDVSENKSLEEQLRHAQKMESLGVISVGIAHNFNNLLTPILLNSMGLLDEFDESSDEHYALKDIVEAAKRGADLVKQLVTLGRISETHFQITDPKNILLETVNILRKSIDHAITIKTDIPPDSLPIFGNAGHIQQCILNMCFNARDAMPDGGSLFISLESSEITKETVTISNFAHIGKYVVITISDTGQGISNEIQSKVFDPFFTTKGMARGSGLGLSTAYGIMGDHGGFIHLTSKLDEGTTFQLYFPLHEDTALTTTPASKDLEAPRSARKNIPSRALTGTYAKDKCILVIDDERDVLRSSVRILKSAGYKVLQAQNGARGLEIIKNGLDVHSAKEQSGIDLVVLDVVMPNMSGEQVFDSMLSMSIDIPVVITSGYSGTSRISDFLKKGVKSTISKPFERDELLLAVKDAIG